MKELKEFSSEEEYVPRSIQYIVVHCSATRANIPFTEEQLLKCHLQRGFKCIGYHFYITRDGELHHCRPVSEPGAHVRGFICSGPVFVLCLRPDQVLQRRHLHFLHLSLLVYISLPYTCPKACFPDENGHGKS